MSDAYSYRDARLSIWQSAAGEVESKYGRPAGKMTTTSLTAKPQKLLSAKELMRPVDFVAHTVKDAGKPFELLAHGGGEVLMGRNRGR